MDEIQVRDAEDERMACGYNERLPNGEEFALGFSNSQGRIFFSRDLTVAQLRNWGPDKITALVGAVRDQRDDSPATFAVDVSEQVLKGMRTDTRELVSEIAKAILNCKQKGATEAELEFDTLAVLPKHESLFVPHFLVDCQECHDYIEILCADCHSDQFRVEKQALLCSRCGKQVDLGDVRCSEGHSTIVLDAADLVTLTPRQNLLESLLKLIEQASNKRFDLNKEFFRLCGCRLYYSLPGEKVVYSIYDIPELKALLEEGAPDDQISAIRNKLGAFKEKCSLMSTDKCSTCVANRHNGPCFLRLFGLFDLEYTPKPHQGDEYGDYSKTVTIESTDRQMVVAMKSATPSNKALTMREPKGQDIYSQVEQYLSDPTIQVIGISVPRRLEDRFRVRLQMHAKRVHKNLVFIDDRDLAQIVNSVMVKRGLALDQI
jgi:hypothetical protein